LKASDFFDVAKYPSMKFESTSVTSVSSDRIKITGKLTIKDVTKTVTFDTKVSKSGSKTIFESTLLINRLDYNVGTSSWTLANDLYIDLHIEK
jgi:polyisoprenoid-binding protein YceI